MHWFNVHYGKLTLGSRLADTVTTWTGSFTAFMIAVGIVVLWGILGPYFNYSDTWQLVINTGTTIVTFLMVFLIQENQNRQTQRDRHQAEADYSTNLLAKQEIEDLQRELTRIEMEKLDQIITKLDQRATQCETVVADLQRDLARIESEKLDPILEQCSRPREAACNFEHALKEWRTAT